MQSDCKNYFEFLVEEFSGIQAHGSCALWLLDTLSTWDRDRQCGHARISRTWYFGMYNKLRECFHYKCKITFRIALLFWTNIKYSQHVSIRLSEGIRWTSLTAGHLVYFETVTRGSQMKTLAIEPNCWDRSTFLNKHQIPSRSLKGCFSGIPGKSPDCRAFINSRFTFNTRDHLTGAKTLYCFPYDLCFIMIIFILSSVCILPLVCSLQVCILPSVCIFNPRSCSLQSAVCSLQSAVCVLHWPISNCKKAAKVFRNAEKFIDIGCIQKLSV